MIKMKYFLLAFIFLMPIACLAKPDSRDTIKGVVVFTGYANLRYIAKGNYHTYTMGATEIKTDTGVVSIKTEFGYIDLTKNYHFISLDKLQPARLKRKP